MNKQTHFDGSNALENAAVMLDVCRSEYERAGHIDAMLALRGLDITSPVSAQLALAVVHELPALDGLSDLRLCAIAAINEAVSLFQNPMRLAS
jgi:hypothetical protein